MRRLGLTLILLWLTTAPAVAGDAPTAMLDRKYFTDLGDFVNVEGSPTGEGTGLIPWFGRHGDR
jgi:hypothetical protein